ncbi:helix-turn-helix domain-containing protein [Loktanella sp. TSTF-M6]|uniref:Helix-turn-helix domain-containing protein n=1 Tax=Loktanella gaetbuli TaxID=2881335 RepID=A0ABS8BTH8_9RHOB|nr:helix-turn-helix transcriptional regulator [Loktanella gaetbuli]MCB5199045.1 helix-turn-helix domain-containing protein [Loktanella gaetbuli]
MDIEEKEHLTGFRKNDDGWIARRLVAARTVAGFSQKAFAEHLGIKTTTYATQEKRGRPDMSVLRYLYRNHGIDFNFMLNGDFHHLPPTLQTALFEALASLAPDYDLRTNSR